MGKTGSGILRQFRDGFLQGSLSPFPVLRRRTPLLPAEHPAEIQRIFISNNPGDFIHRVICCFQQHLCICDADGCDKLHRGCAGEFFEIPDKPTDTHPD